jgi:orotate phosphoribosyltransferase
LVTPAAALVDRSAGEADLGVPLFTLVEINFPTYAPGEVPAELAAKPIEKPGSRKA